MSTFWLVLLGMVSGAGAGLLAGLIGIGGGIVIVPVVFYGLVETGTSADQAAHVAVGTSLAAILPAALLSSLAHWRAGNTDFRFLRDWGPGIATGVVVAQLAAPHVRGSMMTGLFALLCLLFAARFAFPGRFRPIMERTPGGRFPSVAGAAIGLSSGLAGVRHSHEHLHDPYRNADAQEYRTRRSSGCSGQPPSHPRRRIRVGRVRADAARQYRPCRLGIGRACSGRSGMVWGAPGAARCRRQSEPHHGRCLVCDWCRHAAFQCDRAMMGHCHSGPAGLHRRVLQ